MSADRVTNPGNSHDPNDPTDPSRTAVRNAEGHIEQRAEIAAFEAWQRRPRIGVEPFSTAAQGLKRSDKRMPPD